VLEEAIIKMGQSYIPIEFVVMEIGGDDRAPIILGRPFLCTTKAIIYSEHAKIVLSIKDKKEKFSFKNHILNSPAFPSHPYEHHQEHKQPAEPKKKSNRRSKKNKIRKILEETTQLVTAINTENDYLLPRPFVAKREDRGVPIIECKIKDTTFFDTTYDTSSRVNIMAKVVYEYLFGDLPLYPTYMQLQMADLSLRFPEGIAKNIVVKIQDHNIPTDFLVLDIHGDDESPIILRRPFVNTANAIIYMRSGQIHFDLPTKKVRCYFKNCNNGL
jgi:hypothetical protein